MNHIINTIGNLNQPMQSAQFMPIEAAQNKTATAGHRFARLIKRGEDSTLKASVAVEVPVLAVDLAAISNHTNLLEYITASLYKLQDGYIKSRAVAGATQIQYEELNYSNLAEFAATTGGKSGIGQLSEERITNWFDHEGARDLITVALAEKMGISESATPDEVKKLELVADSIRNNLKKLASKKPVCFDERSKAALIRALDIVDTGDSMTSRLRDKLTGTVNEVDMADALGL